jgi:two-component system, NtrC family, response regulator AtoC
VSGDRYLVVRGRSTAMRLALPALGSLTIGEATTNDLSISEEGVASEHAIVFLDHGIGVRAVGDDCVVLASERRGNKPGQRERRIATGETVDLELGDRVQLGPLELAFVGPGASAQQARVVSRQVFEEVLAKKAQAGASATATFVRLRVVGQIDQAAIENALESLLRPTDVVTELGSPEYAALLSEINEPQAQQLMSRVATEISAKHGIELSVGMTELRDPAARGGELDELLALAAERMGRPGASQGRVVVSRDPEMQKVMALVERISSSSTCVLILGETGVGKDVVAQMIHDLSPRSANPFLRINCVDLSDSFLEDEGASFLTRARGGTVHLDEVGGLSSRAQLSLGYLLEEAPGSGHDVRFIASSNQDLMANVTAGTFRKDLFFRLNQVTITIPPLRQRTSDVVPLTELFIERAAAGRKSDPPKLAENARKLLLSYDWPGNVRELKNVIERAMLLCTGPTLLAEHLPPELIGGSTGYVERETEEDKAARPASLRDEIAALEKKRILEALAKYPTQRDAAAALDIPMRTFLNRLDALGIPRARGGGGGGKDRSDEE